MAQGQAAVVKLNIVAGDAKGQITSVSLATDGSGVLLNAITEQTAKPQDTVTITAILNGGGTADSYSFTQVDGDLVVLSGTGASRTFTAPSTPDGSIIHFSITATVAGSTSPAVTATVNVRPQQLWLRQGGAWVPIREQVFV